MPLQPLASESTSSPLSDTPAPARELSAVARLPDFTARAAAVSAQGEKERLSAWRARHQWREVPLHPYSMARDEIWAMLCESDVPLPADHASTALDTGHARKLLFTCAMSAETLQRGSLPELLEASEVWADHEIPRAQARAALDLARLIRHESQIMRARLRPAERKTDSGNAAVPVFEASYYTMLASALRGSLTLDQMAWDVALSRGWSLIHGWWIMEGHATLWLDRRASKAGQWFAEFRQRHQRRS